MNFFSRVSLQPNKRTEFVNYFRISRLSFVGWVKLLSLLPFIAISLARVWHKFCCYMCSLGLKQVPMIINKVNIWAILWTCIRLLQRKWQKQKCDNWIVWYEEILRINWKDGNGNVVDGDSDHDPHNNTHDMEQVNARYNAMPTVIFIFSFASCVCNVKLQWKITR